jgi:hypothetical protein
MRTAIILALLIAPAWAASQEDNDFNTTAVETCLEKARQENAELPGAKYFNAYFDPATQSLRTSADNSIGGSGEVMKFAMKKCLVGFGWKFQ